MPHTLIQLYAKPTLSIIIQPTNNQRFLSPFLYRIFRADGSETQQNLKQLYKQIVKHIFAAYQKMMLSMETVLLAFELMESCQFRNLIQKELENHQNQQKTQSFQSVNTSRSSLPFLSQRSIPQKTSSLLLHMYAIALLYMCHKITDDLRHKFTSNVWVQNLGLEAITKEDIQRTEAQIAVSFQFDIFRPTVYNLVSMLIDQMNIRKSQFAHFVCYLLEMYMNTSLNRFFGQSNRVKRVHLTLGAVKLACHFLYPGLWDEGILINLNFGSEGVEKYSRILFSLFMDKEKNIMIHEKYKMNRYKRVSNIRIVNLGRPSRKSNCSTEEQSQQKSAGSEEEVKQRYNYTKQKGYPPHQLLEVTY